MQVYVESIGPRGRRNYRKATRQEVLEVAAGYTGSLLVGQDLVANPTAAATFVRTTYAGYEHEVFGAVFLDNRHRVIHHEILFRGTIDGASVHPREVVKRVLDNNAAAVIFFHNHPSGSPEPSNADEMITKRLRDALALIDVRVVDHVIAAGDRTTSFAERGLL